MSLLASGAGANAPAPVVAVELPRYEVPPFAAPSAAGAAEEAAAPASGDSHNRQALTGLKVCHPTLAAAADATVMTATENATRVRVG